MHCCEFCNLRFQPRPQVKRPRACSACQKKRQRENEKAWHSKNKAQFGARYHQLQKVLRFKELKGICAECLKCFGTGFTFHGKDPNLEVFEDYFFTFLLRLGIRRVNKFWLVV